MESYFSNLRSLMHQHTGYGSNWDQSVIYIPDFHKVKNITVMAKRTTQITFSNSTTESNNDLGNRKNVDDIGKRRTSSAATFGGHNSRQPFGAGSRILKTLVGKGMSKVVDNVIG